MEEEMLEDDDWLKMEKPPEWLQPVEQEEYDEWIPPPRQPLLPPPPPVSRHCLVRTVCVCTQGSIAL